jgi:hypothetical protein
MPPPMQDAGQAVPAVAIRPSGLAEALGDGGHALPEEDGGEDGQHQRDEEPVAVIGPVVW